MKIYSQRTEIEGLSKRVSISEIENNNFNLSVGRYIKVHAEKEKIDINETRLIAVDKEFFVLFILMPEFERR